jgi:hypothetical protein
VPDADGQRHRQACMQASISPPANTHIFTHVPQHTHTHTHNTHTHNTHTHTHTISRRRQARTQMQRRKWAWQKVYPLPPQLLHVAGCEHCAAKCPICPQRMHADILGNGSVNRVRSTGSVNRVRQHGFFFLLARIAEMGHLWIDNSYSVTSPYLGFRHFLFGWK